MNEFEIIDRLKSLSDKNISLNLEDDTALLSGNLLITKDMLVEGIHFLKDSDPKELAHKILAVNVSDIAAMGGIASHYLLASSLPKNYMNNDWLSKFIDGLKLVQKHFNIKMIGGDTTSSNNDLVFSVTMMGNANTHGILRQNAAKTDDIIYVTNKLGGAYLGLQGIDKYQSYYNMPEPPYKFGNSLPKLGVKCATDISDGILLEIQRIAKFSGLVANINLDNIPIIDENYDQEKQITFGDDYQLVFTANNQLTSKLENLASKHNITISNIGFMSDDKKASQNLRIYNSEKKIVNFEKLGYIS